jgi:hypothetical protein
VARGRRGSGAAWLGGGDGREPYPDEIRAYAALDEQNAARLRAVGIETAGLL